MFFRLRMKKNAALTDIRHQSDALIEFYGLCRTYVRHE